MIGSSGQLARALMARVVDGELAGAEFRCVGRPDVDLCHPGSLKAEFDAYQPSLVVNAAAYTAVDKAEADELKAYQVNALGVNYLAHACKAAGAQLIHLSTDYVFGGDREQLLLESDPVEPLNAYGRTKLAGEWAALSVLPESVVIRTSWVYSQYDGNFVSTMLRLAQSRDELSIVDDQFGRPTNADDLADMVVVMMGRLLAEPDGDFGGVYHFSNSGEVVSWHDFAEEIFSQAARCGLKVPSVVRGIPGAEYPTPAVRPRWTVMSVAKIEGVLGINIPDWKVSLERHFNSYYKDV